MKHLAFLSIFFVTVACAFAAETAAMPESSVPTPADMSEISSEIPDLGAKESEDWQKMRAERKAAREQILSKLRESSREDKRLIRESVSEKRNVKSRSEGNGKNFQSREREPFYERPDSRNMNPMRGYPGPAFEGDRMQK